MRVGEKEAEQMEKLLGIWKLYRVDNEFIKKKSWLKDVGGQWQLCQVFLGFFIHYSMFYKNDLFYRNNVLRYLIDGS